MNQNIENKHVSSSDTLKTESQVIKPATPDNTASSAVAVPSSEPIVIAVDHGYGNIKNSAFIFPACVTPCDDGLSLSADDVLIYEGKSYSIGVGHKEFRQDKIMDEDYYILTLTAIGKELRRRSLTNAKIILATGLPLTWAERQREQFKAYLSKNAHVDFS